MRVLQLEYNIKTNNSGVRFRKSKRITYVINNNIINYTRIVTINFKYIKLFSAHRTKDYEESI